MMKATDLKRMARMVEWTNRVADCRSSGLSVRDWCKEQGICYQTYYRWEQCVLAAESAKQEAAAGIDVQQSRLGLPALAPVFAELTPPNAPAPAQSPVVSVVATIRYGGISIDLHDGVEPSFVASLCKEFQYAQ